VIHLQLNPNSGVPVYRQLMEQIKYHVAARTLKAGDQLPTIRDLAQRLSVNPTTVVKAYGELEHEGIIEMRHGKGAFVAQVSAKLSEKELRNALRQVARQLAVEAAQMGAPIDTVLRIVREEFDDINRTAREN
jgi:GntR family transcriptional regulator